MDKDEQRFHDHVVKSIRGAGWLGYDEYVVEVIVTRLTRCRTCSRYFAKKRPWQKDCKPECKCAHDKLTQTKRKRKSRYFQGAQTVENLKLGV